MTSSSLVRILICVAGAAVLSGCAHEPYGPVPYRDYVPFLPVQAPYLDVAVVEHAPVYTRMRYRRHQAHHVAPAVCPCAGVESATMETKAVPASPTVVSGTPVVTVSPATVTVTTPAVVGILPVRTPAAVKPVVSPSAADSINDVP